MIKIDENEMLVMYWNTPTSDDNNGDRICAAENRVLDVQIMYAGRAWLGFGIPTDVTIIKNSPKDLRLATAVIGSPHNSKVLKYRLDRTPLSSSLDTATAALSTTIASLWTSPHRMDQKHQTLLDVKIVQSQNNTRLFFKECVHDIKRETGVGFVPNAANTIMLAVGSGNRFGRYKDGTSEPQLQRSYLLTFDMSQEPMVKNHIDTNESSVKNNPENERTPTDDSHPSSAPTKEVPDSETRAAQYTVKFCLNIGVALTIIVVSVHCRSHISYYCCRMRFRNPPLPKIVVCDEVWLLNETDNSSTFLD